MQSLASEWIAKFSTTQRGEDIDLVVRAGAGAGKTTELVARVLSQAYHRYQKNGKLPRFIVTTFTRKATQELRERIMAEALRTNYPPLIKFAQSKHYLHVSTIHGVLSYLLGRFTSFGDLGPEISLIDELTDRKLRKKVLLQILQADTGTTGKLLPSMKLPAILESLRLYEESHWGNLKLKRIDYKDFTSHCEIKWQALKKTGEELVSQLRAQETTDAWLNWIEAITEFIAQISNLEFPLRAARTERLLESLPSVRKTKRSTEQTQELKKAWLENLKCFCDFNHSEDFFNAHEDASLAFQEVALTWIQKLGEVKRQQGQYSISDLEFLALRMSREHPEMLKLFSQEWDYWFIDEYQDTSPRQVELLRNLMGDRKSFVVGDPQQSIYLFRGARSEVFLQKVDENKRRGGSFLSLQENYRSQKSLLEFFNFFFSQLGNQFISMKASSESDPKLPVSKDAVFYDLTEFKEQAVKPVELESQAASQRIQELLVAGVEAEEIVVLARRNVELSELALLCRHLHIPVMLNSSARFYARREIRDALCVLKFLLNPHDDLNLIELLRSPWFFLSDQELATSLIKSDSSAWHKIQADYSTSIDAIQLLSETLGQTAVIGIGQCFRNLVLKSGLLDFSSDLDPSGRREANLWKLLEIIQMKERQPGFSYIEFVQQKLRGDEDDEDETDATPVVEPKKVNLMTIHASKGLQFSHVILIGAGSFRNKNRALPLMVDELTGMWSLSMVCPQEGVLKASIFGEKILDEKKQKEIEEYDRLLYVALTRARKSVTLIYSKREKNSWAERMWSPPLTSGPEMPFSYELRQELSTLVMVKPAGDLTEKLAKKKLLVSPSRQKNLSVSQLLEVSNKAQQRSQLWDFKETLNRLSVAQRGTEIHEFFERAGVLEKLSMTEQQKKWIELLRSWEGGKLFNVLQSGEREWGFIIREGQVQIQGKVDLWGRDENDEVWVIDYKTGKMDFLEKAFDQIAIYHWALERCQKLTGVSQVNWAVIYPLEGQIISRSAQAINAISNFVREKISEQIAGAEDLPQS